jgi:hypothetical protein
MYKRIATNNPHDVVVVLTWNVKGIHTFQSVHRLLGTRKRGYIHTRKPVIPNLHAFTLDYFFVAAAAAVWGSGAPTSYTILPPRSAFAASLTSAHRSGWAV